MLYQIIKILSEIIVFNRLTFNQFLKKLVNLLIKIIPVDSCLIYFYDWDKKELILISSKKPKKNLLGKIKLKWGEGITGWVAEHKKTVVLAKKAYEDSRFKFFKELPEDRYEAFLSVPIIDSSGVVGVVNLQNKKPYYFKKKEIELVELIVKMIASAFAKIVLEREVISLKEKLVERKLIEKAKGILMKEKKISEDEAYHLLRKEAMKKRKKITEIAQAVLLAQTILKNNLDK